MSQTAERANRDKIESKRSAVVVELSKLPLFPAAALKLLRISGNPDVEPAQYEEVFKSDVGLAAELLLVVNSAAFGGRSRIDSIRHAIVFLGLERVKALANTIAFCFYVRKAPRIDYVRQIWSHAVATATLAQKIGELHGRSNSYTAGLMHDLGRLVLLKGAAKEYTKELSGTFPSIEAASELEKALFGMTHCEAGSLIASRWAFPENLRRCMADHHADPDSQANDELHDVRLACRSAELLGYHEVRIGDPGPSDAPDLAAYPQFDRAELQSEIAKRVAMLDG